MKYGDQYSGHRLYFLRLIEAAITIFERFKSSF